MQAAGNWPKERLALNGGPVSLLPADRPVLFWLPAGILGILQYIYFGGSCHNFRILQSICNFLLYF